MKNIPKSLIALFMLSALIAVSVPQKVSAATVINTPAGGECYKGGSNVDLAWTISGELFAHHSHVAYSDDTTYPAHNQPSNIPGGSNYDTKSPLGWTLPTVTGSSFSIKVTSLSSLNTPNSAAVSNMFSIDASGPSTPSLSVKAASPTSVDLVWSASVDPGCMPLTGYKVFRNNQVIATTTGLSYTDTNRTPGKSYTYYVQAYDGFETSNSQAYQLTLPTVPVANNTGPTTPEESAVPVPDESSIATVSPPKAEFSNDKSRGELASTNQSAVKKQDKFLFFVLVISAIATFLAGLHLVNPKLLPNTLNKLKPRKLKLLLLTRAQSLSKKVKHLTRSIGLIEHIGKVQPVVIAPTKTTSKHAASYHKKPHPTK